MRLNNHELLNKLIIDVNRKLPRFIKIRQNIKNKGFEVGKRPFSSNHY